MVAVEQLGPGHPAGRGRAFGLTSVSETFTEFHQQRWPVTRAGCASNGSVACWGENELWPGHAAGRGATFTAVSSGSGHTCGLRVRWLGGLLGPIMNYGQATPPADEHPSPPSAAAAVTRAGCAANGTPVCWGHESLEGQATRRRPEKPSLPSTVAGRPHLCGLRAEWDGKSAGDRTATLAQFDAAGGGNCSAAITQRYHSYNHTCGLRRSRGLPSVGARISFFGVTRRPPQVQTFSAVGSGDRHTCGLRADGSVPSVGAAQATGTAVSKDKLIASGWAKLLQLSAVALELTRVGCTTDGCSRPVGATE